MLELPLPANYLAGIRMYSERELIGRHRVPNGRQLDTLADALASIEYYLEALREQRPNRDDILDIARNSLEALGYWPLPAVRSRRRAVTAASPGMRRLKRPPKRMPAVAFDDADKLGLPEIDGAERGRTALAPVPPAPVATPAPVGSGRAGGFEVTGDEIDDEIREVFLEEFEEEIDNLDQMLPPWRAAPEDMEKLRPIRRVFHTLKGSGRLVGAKTLGEFSWKIESMLNRVLDGTRPASPAVVAMVDQAFYALPQLHAALRGEGGISADLEGMQAFADRIAAGEDVFYTAPPSRTLPRWRKTSSRSWKRRRPKLVAETAAAEPAEDTASGQRRSGAAGNPRSRGRRTPGHGRALGRRRARRAGLRRRRADARHPHHERRVRDDRSAVDHRRDDAGRGLRQAPAGRPASSPRAKASMRWPNSPMPRARPWPRCRRLRRACRVSPHWRRACGPARQPAGSQPAVRRAAGARRSRIRSDSDDAGSARSTWCYDLTSGRCRRRRPTSIDAAVEAERSKPSAANARATLEAERVEADRVEAERLEAERVEAERVEAERLEAERVEAERLEAERAEAERARSRTPRSRAPRSRTPRSRTPRG